MNLFQMVGYMGNKQNREVVAVYETKMITHVYSFFNTEKKEVTVFSPPFHFVNIGQNFPFLSGIAITF